MLPQELARRETRLAKIREAKRALEEEARQDKDDHDGPPQARIKTEPDPQTCKERVADSAQRNFTDPESRIKRRLCKATTLNCWSTRRIRSLLPRS